MSRRRLPLAVVRERHRSRRCSATTPRSAPSPAPKTPGSAYVLLHHLMGEHEGAGGWGFIKGGMGAITQAIAQSGQRFGLEIRTDSPIAKVLTERGPRHRRRRPRSGDELPRPGRGLEPRRQDADAQVRRPRAAARRLRARHLRGYRTFSTAFKINVACHRPPQYTRVRPGQGRLRLPDLRPHRARHRLSRARLRRREVRLAGRSSPSSRPSCRRSATTRWPRPASTSSTCSAATRPTS